MNVESIHHQSQSLSTITNHYHQSQSSITIINHNHQSQSLSSITIINHNHYHQSLITIINHNLSSITIYHQSQSIINHYHQSQSSITIIIHQSLFSFRAKNRSKCPCPELNHSLQTRLTPNGVSLPIMSPRLRQFPMFKTYTVNCF